MTRKLLALTMLVISVLACALPGSGDDPTTPPLEAVQTSVAATLTASAPVVNPGLTAASPTDTAAAPADTPAASTPQPPAVSCPVAVGFGPTVLCVDGPNQIELASAPGLQIMDVAVSPDGGLVAYTAGTYDGGNELWVVNADGTGARRLAGRDQLPATQPDSFSWPRTFQWRAGTHQIFFDTGWTPFGGVQGPGEYINNDLWLADADTGELTQMLTAGSGGVFWLSPDGAWVAVSQGDSVDLLSADGAVVLADVVTFAGVSTYSEYTYKPQVTWAPDSAFFTTVIPSPDPLAPETAATVWRVNTNGAIEPLINVPGNFVFGGHMRPSPDGQWVAYVTIAGDGSNVRALHVTRMDGSGAGASELMGDLHVEIYDWSPDSLKFPVALGDQGLFVAGFTLNPQPLAPGVQAVKKVVWRDPATVVFSGAVNDHWGLRQAAYGGAGAQDIAGPFGFEMVFDVR